LRRPGVGADRRDADERFEIVADAWQDRADGLGEVELVDHASQSTRFYAIGTTSFTLLARSGRATRIRPSALCVTTSWSESAGANPTSPTIAMGNTGRVGSTCENSCCSAWSGSPRNSSTA